MSFPSTWYNGLTLSRSVGNPDSMFEKVRKTLCVNGPLDRQSIFRSLGKKGNSHTSLFQYLIRNGLIEKVGKDGRYVLYNLSPMGKNLDLQSDNVVRSFNKKFFTDYKVITDIYESVDELDFLFYVHDTFPHLPDKDNIVGTPWEDGPWSSREEFTQWCWENGGR